MWNFFPPADSLFFASYICQTPALWQHHNLRILKKFSSPHRPWRRNPNGKRQRESAGKMGAWAFVRPKVQGKRGELEHVAECKYEQWKKQWLFNLSNILKDIYIYTPGSCKCEKHVPFHQKNLSKGRNFTYLEDPGIHIGVYNFPIIWRFFTKHHIDS